MVPNKSTALNGQLYQGKKAACRIPLASDCMRKENSRSAMTSHTQNDDHLRAIELFQKAYSHQLEGELEQAIVLYQQSIAFWPTAEAHTFLGWTYSLQERYDAAIEECHRAIAVDPDFGNPYNDIGAYLIEQGRPHEAIPWLEKATQARRYESYHFPHYNLGRVYEKLRQWGKAIQSYRSSLSHNAGYSLAKAALFRLQSQLN
jgi:Tfp pilus assembly protein PilF